MDASRAEAAQTALPQPAPDLQAPPAHWGVRGCVGGDNEQTPPPSVTAAARRGLESLLLTGLDPGLHEPKSFELQDRLSDERAGALEPGRCMSGLTLMWEDIF